MSYFKRHDAPGAPEGEPQTEVLPPQQTGAPNADQDQHPPSTGARVAELRARISGAFQSFDKGRIAHPSLGLTTPVRENDHDERPVPEQAEPSPHEVIAEVPPRAEDSHFPIGPLGYHRAAVDERIAELEEELEELRGETQPLPLNEEIERLGEQTASILIVAHDQASETTRRAQEQADRCIADAAANAVAMTAQAKSQLQDLDNETDSIWRERQRLLDDARDVGLALIALAEEGMERFPGEGMERLSAKGTERSAGDGMAGFRAEGMQRFPAEEMERFPAEGMQRFPADGMERFPADGIEGFSQEVRDTPTPEQ